MITTTKQEIRKAVMKALEEKQCGVYEDRFGTYYKPIDHAVSKDDYSSVADLVADNLGGE